MKDQRARLVRDSGGGQRIWRSPLRLGCAQHAAPGRALPLYGHEISDTINVWEARLDRFCKMEKPDFIGRAALEKAKVGGREAKRWSGWR